MEESRPMKFVMLSENTRYGNDTGAGLMRNRCAFTSRDMGTDWPEAFTYAIVLGWDDAISEVAERFEWDETLIAFLQDAHERFKKLPDKQKADQS